MGVFRQMNEQSHERVCFHHDEKTGLRAIVAIHSTNLGNALGGTRRWYYNTEEDGLYDVLRLSAGMTYKAACANLPMGGAKSVILLPEPGAQPSESEARAMGRFVDTFHGEYIAAEDVGVTPQFVDWMAMETNHVMGGEKVSKGGDPSPYTARGVVNGMKACLTHLGKTESFQGVSVAIQGLGHVGYNVAQIVTRDGGTVYAADIHEDHVKQAERELGVKPLSTDEILTTKCDILAPCALGGVIDAKSVSRLNCSVVCGGANNILDDPDEDALALKQAGIIYAPDFVVNAGGLIRLAGLYLGMSESQIDQKIAQIEQTTTQILEQGNTLSSTHAAAIEIGRQRIAQGGSAKRVTASMG